MVIDIRNVYIGSLLVDVHYIFDDLWVATLRLALLLAALFALLGHALCVGRWRLNFRAWRVRHRIG